MPGSMRGAPQTRQYGVNAARTVSLAPVPATITGPDGLPAPLGAVRDGKGVTSLFIADELVVNGATAAEIVGLIARYSGSVLQHQDGDYLVKVDASQFPRTGAALDAAALNFCQPATASSEVMARLVAIWLHEARGGLSVALNGVDTPAFR